MSVRQMRIGSTSFIALAVATISAPAFAQNSDADDQPSDAKEIVVTGSLIRGSSEEAPAPVDVIGAEELSKQGSPSAIDLLKNLPNSSGIIGDANQFDARAQGNEGVASVNLRGLGPQRTLVLLNGKRIVQSGGSGIPIVDVNLIPSGAIGRIEVLKDGAAATYGSDAIAGVVNFITRTNQDGFRASADYRYISGSDGDYAGQSAMAIRAMAGGFSSPPVTSAALNCRQWTATSRSSPIPTIRRAAGPGVAIQGTSISMPRLAD